MRWLAVVALLVAPEVASADPWCGGATGWSPIGGATLPPRAHLVFFRQDRVRGATVPLSRPLARIAGKPVPVTTRDVAGTGYTLRFLEIAGAATGALEIELDDTKVIVRDLESHGVPHEHASYDVDGDWRATPPAATLARYHLRTAKMAEAYRDGLAVMVDAPVIAFAVRWRRTPREAWHELLLPALTFEGSPAVLLGETDCGPPDISLDVLRAGIQLEITATLADGSTAKLRGLDRTVTLPR